ncbi:hypothetical protein GCM10022276_20780 [Sphingomonas limnosediminicola]|jgi:hypothetical protein|uniref:Uncharacterized protein n=1 Tax=Sphingomonas limnosediminicola TaxID=940133 RepID=A0ABP7LIT0_9SPHN
MTQSVLLVAVTALLTWLVMKWFRSAPDRPKPLSAQESEAERAKDVGTRLDGARDRASDVEVERNRLALAKAVKAALWVTDARLNAAVPELLRMAQLWAGKSDARGEKWTPPNGVTDIEGLDHPAKPWASWSFDGHHWRIDALLQPSALPEEIEGDVGTYKVLVDRQLVLDMTISTEDPQLLWVDALTVGPWVSDLLAFSGARTSDAKARSSARSATKNQKRADNIHWS